MIINFEDLSKIRNENINKKIVFCSGSFEITHVGHIIFFEECNKYGNILTTEQSFQTARRTLV